MSLKCPRCGFALHSDDVQTVRNAQGIKVKLLVCRSCAARISIKKRQPKPVTVGATTPDEARLERHSTIERDGFAEPENQFDSSPELAPVGPADDSLVPTLNPARDSLVSNQYQEHEMAASKPDPKPQSHPSPIASSARKNRGWFSVGLVAVLATIALGALAWWVTTGKKAFSDRSESRTVAAKSNDSQPTPPQEDKPSNDAKPEANASSSQPSQGEFEPSRHEIVQTPPTRTPLEQIQRSNAGNLLVGIEVTFSTTHEISSIRPLFRSQEASEEGKPVGTPANEKLRDVARSGYVVSGIELLDGKLSPGFRLRYSKLKERKHVVEDSYYSPVFKSADPKAKNPKTADLKLASIPAQNISVGLALAASDAGLGACSLLSYPAFLSDTLKAELPALGKLDSKGTGEFRMPNKYDGDGLEFAESKGTDGVLVGIRAGIVENPESKLPPSINWVQGIYQVGTKRVLGARFGGQLGTARDVLAKPGHAVCAMQVPANVKGLSLEFAPVEGGKLDVKKKYTEPSLGSVTGDALSELAPGGLPIVGIFGRQSDLEITKLGIIILP